MTVTELSQSVAAVDLTQEDIQMAIAEFIDRRSVSHLTVDPIDIDMSAIGDVVSGRDFAVITVITN